LLGDAFTAYIATSEIFSFPLKTTKTEKC